MSNMSDKWHEIFIAGNYPQGSFSENYIDRVIANFEKEKEAGVPITIDHNRSGPAFGWTGQLRRAGKKLYATFNNVAEELKAAVKTKRYKNISVGFDPTEPRLMEVTFLGAKLPQVKSMQSPTFALPANLICIEFTETTDQDGEDEEDEGNDDLERLKSLVKLQAAEIQELNQKLHEVGNNGQVETDNSKEMSEDAVKYKAMFEDSQRQSMEKEINIFCTDCIKQGYFLPRLLPKVKAFMRSLSVNNEVIELSEKNFEGDPKIAKSFDIFKSILTDSDPPYAQMYTEIVTDKPTQRYNFSEGNGTIPFSQVEAIANERGINKNDSVKMAELIKEISNKNQNNVIDFGGKN